MSAPASWAGGPRWVALLLLVTLGSCDGCGDEPLALLLSHDGDVERDRAIAVETWEPAEDEDELEIGDGIRTLEGAHASLHLRGTGTLTLEPRTLIRFRLSGEGGDDTQPLDVVTGEATLEVEGEPVTIGTATGIATLAAGSRVRIAGGDDARLSVIVGRASLERDGETVELEAGDSVDLEIGRAQIEVDPLAGVDRVAEPEEPQTPPDPEETNETEEGEVRLRVAGGGATWREAEAEDWSALPDGEHRTTGGTRLRLGTTSRVTVRRGDEAAELRGRGEAVIGSDGEALATVLGGAGTIDASRGEVVIEVPGGSIVATFEGPGQGSRADVTVSREGTEVRATEGRVRIRRGDEEEVIERGESFSLAATAPPSGAPEARPEPLPPYGPSRADVDIEPGSSATVHASRPPVVVSMRAEACPDEAVLEAGRRRSRGRGRVSLSLPAGRHAYSMRCVENGVISDDVLQSGVLTVRRDSGRAPVSRLAPTSVIDADGRPYTVIYQNLLPRIVVRWQSAPATGPFTLTFQRGGGRQGTLRSPRARFEIRGLPEGEHELVVSGGGSTSPATRVRIRFDNAAPTASLTEPSDGSFAPGATVHVVGVAQQGWEVSVGGTPLELDGAYRFSGDVTARADRDSLAVRLRHRSRGVHYYLRRARAGGR